jgi:hypothetical protein
VDLPFWESEELESALLLRMAQPEESAPSSSFQLDRQGKVGLSARENQRKRSKFKREDMAPLAKALRVNHFVIHRK